MDQEHEAIWANEGLFVIADAIKARRGDEYLLVGHWGGEDFVCPTFTMRPYREIEDQEDLPNFEFHPAGFSMRWYKYVGRSQTANRPKPPGLMWELAVADCIKAVASWVP